jgi:hypothetical protein
MELISYHSLLSSFLAISSLDIKNEDTSIWVFAHPNTLGSLLSSIVLLVESFKLGIEQ